MRTYKLYRHPTMGLKAVKEGFSWPGFLFGTLWLLGKGLFGAMLVVLGICLVLSRVTDNEVAIFVISLLVSFSIGASGNDMWGKKLTKRGYQLLGKFQAANRQAALAQAVVGTAQTLAA